MRTAGGGRPRARECRQALLPRLPRRSGRAQRTARVPTDVLRGPGAAYAAWIRTRQAGPGDAYPREPRAAPFPRLGGAWSRPDDRRMALRCMDARRSVAYYMICWRRAGPCSLGKTRGCGLPPALTHGGIGAASKPGLCGGPGRMSALPLSGQRSIWKCITCVGRARRRRSYCGLGIWACGPRTGRLGI